jgi:hypothetical protein
MGKKQRLGIKGVVQPVTSAATESSPSTPSATPAPVASAVTPSGGRGPSH